MSSALGIVIVVLGVVVFMILTAALLLWSMFRTEIRNILAARKLKDQEFVCQQCGKCCGYLVVVGDFDKHHLQEAGYNIDECISCSCDVSSLKKVNGACCFLRNDPQSGKKTCGIYNDRLYICRRFPYLNYAGFKAIDTRCPEVQRMLKEA